MQRRVDDRGVGRLALVVGVKEKRVLTEAPTAAVVEPPKSHAFYHVLVFDEDREQPRISIRLGLEILRRSGRALMRFFMRSVTVALSPSLKNQLFVCECQTSVWP